MLGRDMKHFLSRNNVIKNGNGRFDGGRIERIREKVTL